MRQDIRWLVVVAAVSGLLVPAGCVQQDYGWATSYLPDHNAKIAVVMPQQAPSISQQFYRDPDGSGHLGIDIIDKIGTPVLAAAGGQVVDSYFEPAYGNRVTIDHGPNADGLRMMTVYKHLNSRGVSQGARVERGQQIATLGNTGALAGGLPHLHFEVRREVRPQVFRAIDPHRVWAGGVGQVTCFAPGMTIESAEFRSTYPVRCRPGANRSPDVVQDNRKGLASLLKSPS
ncbi:MAG: M23 family metallopeptidase [Hoeflea sp.]|nr:M23 family metallopeptidase [Hoeflea sp.]